MAPCPERQSDLYPPFPDHAPPYSQAYLVQLASWRQRADERLHKQRRREYSERRRAKARMTLEERRAARIEKEAAEKAEQEARAQAQKELLARMKRREEAGGKS
jgi:hypothetical protein